MDEREILTRFKDGTLDRRQAVALLAPAVHGVNGVNAMDAVAAAPAFPDPPASASAPHEPAARELPVRAAPVAVVGMAGRYPGAPDLAAFWHLLCGGRGTPPPPPPPPPPPQTPPHPPPPPPTTTQTPRVPATHGLGEGPPDEEPKNQERH
ncbi:beta-ketoacyl synthase N-terminal-like domain-containing protein, partial [Streptomyces sp. NPDC059874]|uniref:beta-ketoacyl synthase N-terminal-like domain-containing protein n=1 Tax=Streptomyces sp. NPDC059874 TaxID=3346983 RepID=UPI003657F625